MDQNQQNIQDLQKQIAQTLGITDLSDEQQKATIEKATEILLKKIFLMTVEKLSEEDKKAYLELLEKVEKPEEIEKFLTAKIPDYQNFIQKIAQDFITDIKSSASKPA